MDSAGTSGAGHGNYVSLAELAAQLKVTVQTITAATSLAVAAAPWT